MKSKVFKLNIKDVVIGTLMAFLGSFITALYNLISTGSIPTTWVDIKPIVLVGVASMLAYLIKNVFTNSEGKFLTKEPNV